MNVAICVGDTEMPGQKLRQASFFFPFFRCPRREPSHPCGQYATAPLTLIHINAYPESLLLDRARLVSLPVCGGRAAGVKNQKKKKKKKEKEKSHVPPDVRLADLNMLH